MIRQAISCDICGAEKKQTNHWFVAYTHAGELRVSGWSVQRRLRAGTKHLCGQTCLNKLLDEFIAGSLRARAQAPVLEVDEPVASIDASLTSKAAYGSPMRPAKVLSGSILPAGEATTSPAAVIAIASARAVEEPRMPRPALPVDNTPNYASRHWRAEAWERERERCCSLPSHRKTL
jgi:hypothetical protein